MNSMLEVSTHDTHIPASPQSIAPPAMRYRIKRNGGRPLRFNGTELAMAMSYSSDIPFWYEINLYQTIEQSFVTTVRLFNQSEDRQDTVTAWESESLDEALEKITHYDAAYDVRVSAPLDFTDTAAAEAASHALYLASEIADYRQHYKYLVGEFLYDLEDA